MPKHKTSTMLMPANRRKCRFSFAASLLLSLVLLAPSADAQNTVPAPTRTVADSLLQSAREDTIYALQRLFHESRRRYGIQTVMRGVGFGYFVYKTSNAFRESNNAEKKVVNVLALSAFGYLFSRSAINSYRYRSGREKMLLAAFEQGNPLPAKVRKNFKPSYFDTPTTTQ